MSVLKRKYVGKIGWVSNKNLGINKTGGHYVYIRKVDVSANTCTVNTITSLEHIDRKTGKKVYTNNKLNQVKKGNTYSIPVTDANFVRWSGITKNAIPNVNVSDVKDLDKMKIKNRHKFFVGKYIK